MPAYFADYRWSNREPQGISPIDDPTGKEHFRLFDVDGGVRLEQFDRDGRFLRLVYCPQDRSRQRGATNEVSADRRYKIRRGDDGTVRAYEEFVWPEDRYSEGAHPVANVFNEHGRFLFQHRPKKVSASAVDIYVHDSLGKLIVILHHTDIDGTEPCTIEEEWMK